MIFVIVGAETGKTTVPAIRGRVEGDVDCGLGDQEGHSVPGLDGGLPPSDIGVKIFRQVDRFIKSGRETFGSQASVEEKPAS